jgi:carbon monoxide dehydrogenase subunit G
MPKVEGSEQLGLDRAEVWRLLNDPDTLAASIPGCNGFERDGEAEHRYRTAIAVAVGPVTGVYEGTVEYLDVAEPERCTIVVAGKGDKGTIDGRGQITLAAHDGGTEVGYVGDFKLTGPVAGVGQRMAPGVSRKMIVETLHNLERRGEPAPEPAAAEGATAEADAAQKPPGAEAPAPSPGGAAAPRAGGAAEPFRPVSISPLAAFAAGCTVGIVLGVVLRR